MIGFPGRMVFLDTETTGLDTSKDKIIEIAIIVRNKDNAALLGKKENEPELVYETLINPETSLNPFISTLTGITDEMLLDKPVLSEKSDEIKDILSTGWIVAHNAYFDVSILESNLNIKIDTTRILDTLELAKIIYPSLNSYKLISLIRYFGLEQSPDHRAMDDTKALLSLYDYLMKKAYTLPRSVVRDIIQSLSENEKGIYHFFVDLYSDPNYNPVEVSTKDIKAPLSAESIEEMEEKSKQKAKDKAAAAKKASEYLYVEKQLDLIGPSGALSKIKDNFSHRKGQQKMLSSVYKAIRDSRFLMAEAPTGIGKSLAYLIPSLTWAVSQQEKVVVATNTIFLQEQLIKKDIPEIKSFLPFEFDAAVLKGRNNYLCLSRFRDVLARGQNLIWGERILLARIAVWLYDAKNLSRDEFAGDMDFIHLLGPERDWFSQMASNSDTCQGRGCPYFKDCFFQKARTKAKNSDLLVINHALLLSDAALNEAIIGGYRYLVIDEAHHLEDEGNKYFTPEVSLMEFEKFLQQLHKRRDVFGRPGFIQYIKDFNAQGLGDVSELIDLATDLEKSLKLVLKRLTVIRESLKNITLPENIRVKYDQYRNQSMIGLFAAMDNLRVMSLDLSKKLAKIGAILSGDTGEVFEETWLKTELTLFARICEMIDTIDRFLKIIEREDTENVYWMKYSEKFNDLTIYITPLDLSKCFDNYLYKDKESIIFTSATLSVGESFDYYKEQLGIDPERLDTLRLDSPFDYTHNVKMFVDKDMPDPTKTTEDSYNFVMVESLKNIIEKCGGQTLVLFTAIKQMKTIYSMVAPALQAMGLELLCDGVNGTRNSMVEELKANPKAVVFGANTFWEGVDLPGLALTSLIIVKLPFQPPNVPVVEAKIEQIKARGDDAFGSYSLPQAVIRFKQGYGRLIRTAEDFGEVIVLDSRIITKRYGSVFLGALPDRNIMPMGSEEIAKNIEAWHKERGNNG